MFSIFVSIVHEINRNHTETDEAWTVSKVPKTFEIPFYWNSFPFSIFPFLFPQFFPTTFQARIRLAKEKKLTLWNLTTHNIV